ncbi:TetR/AcrR family transcriptional regulator [Nocardioides caeni]|uniref:Helix-turn-helix transcriptional regulator n=1 Tax=Nocardioides caeni TaxID=574700 RepID=A0A4S8NR25_9ACTN|nr:TetR/AcrR family transcriptional regulator [Nocardioides caeni]THV17924.1 helix-turn-helix transcriptional regulator [Nocardioides caeni]
MPRIHGETLRDHRVQVHQSVLEAFAELMVERSFESISMREIAERAGLGRTAIYHHFSDREAVLVAFATRTTRAYVTELRAALEQAATPSDRLRVYVHHHLAAGEQFHMGLGPSLVGQLSETARLEMRHHIESVEAVLREIVLDGQASGEFGTTDVEAALSLIHACLVPRHLPASAIEDFVLRAVGVSQPVASH